MRRARWKVCGMGRVFSRYNDSKSRQFLNSKRRLGSPRIKNATGLGLHDSSGSGVLRDPIRDGVEGLGSHGFFDAAVFGGRACGSVLEKMAPEALNAISDWV